MECHTDLQLTSVRDFLELTKQLHRYIQYLKFQFTMPLLSRHYDVIFRENLQKGMFGLGKKTCVS